MATDLNWPVALPKPLLEPHGYKPQPPVIRTDMEQGAARHRRRSTCVPTLVPFGLLLTDAEQAMFESWVDHYAQYGAAWFNVPLRSAIGLADHEARFHGELEYKLIRRDLWRVDGTFEVRERPMMSLEDLDDLIAAS